MAAGQASPGGTEWMLAPEHLSYVENSGKLAANLAIPGCTTRVLKFAAGDEIPFHHHTGASVKVVLRGAISFESPEGPLGVASEGTIYFCGSGIYRGTVLTDAYVLVVEEAGSEAVPAPQ